MSDKNRVDGFFCGADVFFFFAKILSLTDFLLENAAHPP